MPLSHNYWSNQYQMYRNYPKINGKADIELDEETDLESKKKIDNKSNK